MGNRTPGPKARKGLPSKRRQKTPHPPFTMSYQLSAMSYELSAMSHESSTQRGAMN